MKYLQQHDDCTGKELVQLKSAKAKYLIIANKSNHL